MVLTLFLKALLRGGIPFVIMSGIAGLLWRQRKLVDAKGTFFSALIFLVVGMATVIYDIEQWSLLKQTLIHFGLMVITVYPILLISGWFPVKGLKNALVVFGYFLIFGIVIWTIMFFLAKIFNW